jgi:hypothetical protein
MLTGPEAINSGDEFQKIAMRSLALWQGARRYPRRVIRAG